MSTTPHGAKPGKATPIKKAAGGLDSTTATTNIATQIIAFTARIKGAIIRCAAWLAVVFPGGGGMSDPIEHFRLAIAAAGLPTPTEIITGGAIHRFSTNGKRGDDSGWYMLHTDGIAAGAFGCWRTGLQSTWCAKSDHAMTDAERDANRNRIAAMKVQRDAQILATQQQASQTAAELWQAGKSAPAAND